MSASLEDLESFHAFAEERLASGVDRNLVDLAAEWRQFRQMSDGDRTEDVAAVREAIDAHWRTVNRGDR